MAHTESLSFQQAHPITDGNETSSPKSAASSRKRKGGKYILTMREQREVVRLYKAKAGSAKEIARAFNVSHYTIYYVLDRFGVQRHRAGAGAAISASLKARNERIKQAKPIEVTPQIAYVPEVEFAAQVQEQTQAPTPRAKRRVRKPLPWWRSLINRLFKK